MIKIFDYNVNCIKSCFFYIGTGILLIPIISPILLYLALEMEHFKYY